MKTFIRDAENYAEENPHISGSARRRRFRQKIGKPVLTLVSKTDTEITIEFARPTGYDITYISYYRDNVFMENNAALSNDPTHTWPADQVGVTKQAVDNGLTPSTTYVYKVVLSNVYGGSVESDPLSVTTDVTPP